MPYNLWLNSQDSDRIDDMWGGVELKAAPLLTDNKNNTWVHAGLKNTWKVQINTRKCC